MYLAWRTPWRDLGFAWGWSISHACDVFKLLIECVSLICHLFWHFMNKKRINCVRNDIACLLKEEISLMLLYSWCGAHGTQEGDILFHDSCCMWGYLYINELMKDTRMKYDKKWLRFHVELIFISRFVNAKIMVYYILFWLKLVTCDVLKSIACDYLWRGRMIYKEWEEMKPC